MLAPKCGLMHNDTSAVSLQVQRVVSVTLFQVHCDQVLYCMCVSTSVTKLDLLYTMCSWQMKMILVLNLVKLGKYAKTGISLANIKYFNKSSILDIWVAQKRP